MTIEEEKALAKLGCPIEEIGAVAETDAGIVITMRDGSSYIDVPDDHPDGAGKTGLMYREAPSADYHGHFPVYEPTLEELAASARAIGAIGQDEVTREKIAAKLGCPIHEISDVTVTPAGVVITMAGGSSYIDVPTDHPDGAGQTGLMYLKTPKNVAGTYSGNFPAYEPPLPASWAL